MDETCQAAVFAGPERPMESTAFALPRLGPGELLTRVTCCTLCGSDLHTYQGRRSTPVPTILGHEILGVVAAMGPGEALRDLEGRTLETGDRITWSIMASCGECFFCRDGIPQKCERLFKYGHEKVSLGHPLSGGLAEYCHLARGTALMRVPDALPDEAACPVNCATATVAGAMRVGAMRAGETVLVQGAGMLGLTACALARSRGAREVVVSDVDGARLELARRFGATRCALAGDLARAVEEATNGRGVDLAIEVSGAATAMEAGLELLRIGGRCVFVGAVFPGPAISVSPEAVVRRLLSIRGLHNYAPEDLRAAVTFLAKCSGDYPFAELVTDSFALSEVEAAFKHAIESKTLRVAVKP